MEWLFILGLLAFTVHLWNRLHQTEARLRAVEQWRDQSLFEGPVASAVASAVASGGASIEAGSAAPDRVGKAQGSVDEPDASQTGPWTSPANVSQPVQNPPADDPAKEAALAYAVAGSADDEQNQAVHENGIKTSGFSLSNLDFEDIFGRRLPIWAGGVALALAGVFLVRYSIESGLLTPSVRVTMAFVFGAALLAAAEAAYRQEARIADPRVRQALAGAGLATLYAAFYLAGSQYGLIGQTVAFLGLAGVTAASIALSFRFGLPSAVLGLVGGFAAPALVGGDEANLPVLALYLGLVTGGLCFTGREQKRAWMGIGALVGGLGWGMLLLLGDGFGFADILALGVYFIALGAIFPTLVEHDKFTRPLRAAAAFLASLQLAMLVAKAGHAPLAWGLYLLLGATLAWFGWRRDDMRIASPVAAVIGVLLLSLWIGPDPAQFAIVSAGLAAVFAGVPMALLWRERDSAIEWGMIGVIPPAIAALAYAAFGTFELDRVETSLALATLGLAALPALGAYLLVRRGLPLVFAALTGSACALVFAAGLMVTPGWGAPLVAAAALSAPAYLIWKRQQTALLNVLWIGAGVSLLALIVTPGFFAEASRLVTASDKPDLLHGLLRWAAACSPWLALALLESRSSLRRGAEIGAALLAYGFAAQLVPALALAWLAALGAIALYLAQSSRVGGYATWTVLALGWACYPLGQWATAGLQSLVGDPILLIELPPLDQLALRIVPAAAALALVRYAGPIKSLRPVPAQWLAVPLALIVVHVLYRQIFAISTITDFMSYGMAERTVWQALLLGAGWLAAHGIPRWGSDTRLAIALAAASLAHFALYSLWWHNPMTAHQAVGPTPVANLFLASYAVAIMAFWLLRRWLPDLTRPAVDGAIMFLATLGTLALLRQAFGGSIPFDVPMSQSEDLLRSLIGIVMALLFLWLGSRLQQRSWRIGSLAVMLIAVVKVFAFDAAELTGLLRIASFAALGISLIALGWFYTRQLKANSATRSTTSDADPA